LQEAMADHYRQGLMFEACQQVRHAALHDSVNTKLVDHVLSVFDYVLQCLIHDFSPVIARCLDVQYCCADGASLFELLMCVDQLIKAIDVRWVDLEDSRLYGVEEIG
jgi:hypothetical protein